ncbi:hypothetical protein NJB1507_48490 [Mycobacterium marinum]|nr:hypothetical protein NJB1507_48490 [Mycobacterium marinum]
MSLVDVAENPAIGALAAPTQLVSAMSIGGASQTGAIAGSRGAGAIGFAGVLPQTAGAQARGLTTVGGTLADGATVPMLPTGWEPQLAGVVNGSAVSVIQQDACGSTLSTQRL